MSFQPRGHRFTVIQGGDPELCPVHFLDPTVYVVDPATLTAEDKHELTELAARAYHYSGNRVMRYLTCFGGEDAVYVYMAILLELALQKGWVVCRRDPYSNCVTSTCWFIRPGEVITPAEQIAQLPQAMRVTGYGLNLLRLLWDLQAIDASHARAKQLMQTRLGSTDHVYALSFASWPTCKGGLKSILSPMLQWCQVQGLPCYLEAADDSNVLCYMHFNFTLQANIGLFANWRARRVHADDPYVYPGMIWWPKKA